MAWLISGQVNAAWVPEGAGPMTVPSMQTLQLDIGLGAVPSGNNPTGVPVIVSTDGTLTAAQVNTACSTFGSLMAAQFGTVSLATLQGWATGQP
jgi:hypothetical protein